jgi:acylphosphatase
MVGLKIIIKGKVQGVGFRWFAKKVADNLGIPGWVRNGADGSVEAYVEGDFYKTGLFCDALRKGPAESNVTSIDIKKVEQENSKDFSILR